MDKKRIKYVKLGILAFLVGALLGGGGTYIIFTSAVPPLPNVYNANYVHRYIDSLRSVVKLEQPKYEESDSGNLSIGVRNNSEVEPSLDVRVEVDGKLAIHALAEKRSDGRAVPLGTRISVAAGNHKIFVSSRSRGVVALRNVTVTGRLWVDIFYWHSLTEPSWSHGSFEWGVTDTMPIPIDGL